MKKLLLMLIVLPISALATKYSIISNSNHPAIEYSIQELKTFLNAESGFYFTDRENTADWEIKLKSNPSLPECAFEVKCYQKGNKQHIELSGAVDKDIPCAVFTLLEKLGYTFEMSGVFKGNINPDLVKNYSETIVPLVKYRGIRQHINFPMDISSYSVGDAKQYICNLARMRFNFIAFHSYPGQWYEVKKKDTIEYAGNFFYGDRHDLPDNALIKEHVHNQTTFCIPEIEAYYDSIPRRSRMSVHWLNEVINEAKRVGMTVQLSFEPRNKSTDIPETLSALQQLYMQYPQVDIIEMITEESGGWGPSNTSEETKNILATFFGNDILNDTVLTLPIQPVQTDLGYIYGQIGHILGVMDAVKKQQLKLPPLKLGIYCTNQYNVPTYHLARKFLTPEQICIMPAHGSANVANNAPKVLTNSRDWNDVSIYSWLEFDGMMYLQQNGIDGIHKLISRRPDKSSDARLNTLAFNHWRTTENKITARYATLATLYGPQEPGAFYGAYAKQIGIGRHEEFRKAMLLLQNAFDAQTSNIGFAWMGGWRNGFNFYSDDMLNDMLRKYEASRLELSNCAVENKNAYAIKTIQFLDNRLRATIIYLKAFVKANELKTPDISDTHYNAISNDVLSIFDECLKVYAEMMPDRGCEGTLINMYLSPIRAIKISRQKKTGIPLDEPVVPTTHFDAPAPPIFNGGN